MYTRASLMGVTGAFLCLLAFSPSASADVVGQLAEIEASNEAVEQRAGAIAEAVLVDVDESPAVGDAIPWLQMRFHDETAEPDIRVASAAGLLWLSDVDATLADLYAMLEEDVRANHAIARRALTVLVGTTSEDYTMEEGRTPPLVLDNHLADNRPELAELVLELLTLAMTGDDGEPLPDSHSWGDSPHMEVLFLYEMLCILPDLGSEEVSAAQQERNVRFRSMLRQLLPEDPGPDADTHGLTVPVVGQLYRITPDGTLRDYRDTRLFDEELRQLQSSPEAFWEYANAHLDL